MCRELIHIYGPISINSYGTMLFLGLAIVVFLMLQDKSCKQIISYDEVAQALETIEFIWATGVEGYEDTYTKIKVLYRLGFLGVYADEKMCEEFHVHYKYAFVFNEADEFVRNMDGTEFGNCKYIIHPLFTQYLNLDASEMILPLTWEYLHENEALRYT